MTAANTLVEVKSSEPPTLTWDAEAGAAYLRFGQGHVAYSEERLADEILLVLDFNAEHELLGIEVVGMAEIQIAEILEKAHVKLPAVDYSRVRYIPAAA